MRLCVLITVTLVLVALFLIGIFLLIPFPLAVFPAIVNSQVYIQQKKDGSYPRATFYWTKLPATEFYDFYFFNITNPDEVVMHGAKVNLVEVGPYSYAESEFKERINFFDDEKQVFFTNNKTWVFNPATSCDTCGYDDVLALPNPAYMSVVNIQKMLKMGDVLVTLGDMLLLILGEYPIRVVPMKGVTFLGYDDPLLDLVNSKFVTSLIHLILPNVTIPYLPTLGYFANYNHTNDGDYTSLTGKGNAQNTALIQKWCNMSHLPWWNSDYAQDISQSSDGSFQQPQLKKTAHLKQFQSFICRAFYLTFEEKTTVNGIPAYTFKMDNDTYDTTSTKNMGYRYENHELVDYFPSWSLCDSNHTYNPNGTNCAGVNCTLSSNFCDSCCNGSYIYDTNTTKLTTILLPPGSFPLRCLPGQPIRVPFPAFITPPHFVWSPPEVQNSVYGLNPDPNGKHFPATFDINPTTGSTVNAHVRIQLVIPFYNDKGYTGLQNTRNNFIPTVWFHIHIAMKDYARNYLYLVTGILPKVILGIGIGLAAISIIGAGILLFCIVRERKNREYINKMKTTYEDTSNGEKEEDWT